MSLGFRNSEDEERRVSNQAFVRLPQVSTKGKESLRAKPKEVAQLKSKSKIRKRSKKGLRYLGVAAIFLSIIGAGSGLFAVNSAGGALQKELEADRAVGLIVDPKQIKEIAGVSAEENGARAYAGAQSMLQASKADLKLIYPKGLTLKVPEVARQIIEGAASSADIALARDWLAHEKDALDGFRNASAFPHVFFDRDYSVAAATLFPEYAYMREGANHLILEAALAVKDGNWALAHEDMLAASRISLHIGEDLPFIAGLVQTSLQSSIYQSTNSILATRWEDPRAVKLVSDVLHQLGEPVPFAKMLRFESLFAVQIPMMAQLSLAKDPRVWTDDAGGMGNGFRMLAVPGVGIAVERIILQDQRHQMQAALRYGDNYIDLEKALNDLQRKQDNSGLLGRLAGSLSAVFMGAPSTLAELAAQRRLIEEGLGAVDVHSRTGQWPTKLPLSGKASIDPHSNLPLKWQSGPTGFRAWSVGKNGIDDGGIRLDNQQGSPDLSKADDPSIRLGSPPGSPKFPGNGLKIGAVSTPVTGVIVQRSAR